MAFTHLHVHSFFSFLDGAASPEDLVHLAVREGYRALALTDHMSLSGAVRFQRAAEEVGLRAILGAEITMGGGGTVVALAEGSHGHRSLCRLLTEARLTSERLDPRATLDQLEKHREGLIFLTGYRASVLGRDLLSRPPDEALARFRTWAGRLGRERIRLEVCREYLPGGRRLETLLHEIAQRCGVEEIAGNDVHVLRKEDFWIQDLLTAIRLKIPLGELHPERRLNGETDLKGPRVMARIFADRPGLLEAAGELAARLSSGIDLRRRLYPSFALPKGVDANDALEREVFEGARGRYGRLSKALEERIRHELTIIRDLGFADYFLLVWDVARFARREGIRMAGRGSMADSVVAYCLGLTEVDAFARELLFERFMSRERSERPDIDLDLDHRHRDEVADYVRRTYGSDRVAAVATFQTFQARSLVREAGRAFGLAKADVERLARRLPDVPADALEEAMAAYPELREGLDRSRYGWILRAGEALAGFPRHIGTHLGGIVVSRTPLDEVSPREMSAKGVEIVPFDKDDVEALGFVKLDLLSLRTLAVLEDAYRLHPEAEGPSGRGDDEATFRQIRHGETIGVFQLESPAQRALQPRLKAQGMEDIVQAMALIRPGPIKGDMVTPFLARRSGEEPITFAHPDLEPILRRTYGVVLFQEQVIEIARIVAGFTAGEADRLRRVMTHARSRKAMAEIGEAFIRRAVARGEEEGRARSIFRMLEGYASYGFPEAHAAAFAQTAYRTAYLSVNEPSAFFAALLSQEPLGYYPPHTIVTEARRRGVRFLPLDVNRSGWAWRLEAGGAVRVGFVALKGLGEEAARRIEAGQEAPYASPSDLRQRVGIPISGLRALILGGAFDALDTNRRRLLTRIEEEAGLFEGMARDIPDFPPWDRFLRQENVLPISGPATVMRALRGRAQAAGILSAVQARRRTGYLRVTGFPLMPHRPPTRSGKTVVFLSLEDETGLLDLILFEDVYQRTGGVLFDGTTGPLLAAGRLRRERGAPVLQVERIGRWRPGAP